MLPSMSCNTRSVRSTNPRRTFWRQRCGCYPRKAWHELRYQCDGQPIERPSDGPECLVITAYSKWEIPREPCHFARAKGHLNNGRSWVPIPQQLWLLAPTWRASNHSTRERMLEKEAQHFPRRVRPSRIGVGAGGTASRPGVAGFVNVPMLGDYPSTGVTKDDVGIGMPVGHPSTTHLRCRTRRVSGLLENSVAVLWMHRGVAIAMENDGRHRRADIRHCVGLVPLPHGDER